MQEVKDVRLDAHSGRELLLKSIFLGFHRLLLLPIKPNTFSNVKWKLTKNWDQSQTFKHRSFLGETRDRYWKESRRTSWLLGWSPGCAASASDTTSFTWATGSSSMKLMFFSFIRLRTSNSSVNRWSSITSGRLLRKNSANRRTYSILWPASPLHSVTYSRQIEIQQYYSHGKIFSKKNNSTDSLVTGKEKFESRNLNLVIPFRYAIFPLTWKRIHTQKHTVA